MNRNELIKWQKSYKENAFYYRGKLIDSFNTLEKTVENYLMGFFKLRQDIVNDFADIILDRLTFESKKGAFNAIMNRKAAEKGFVKTQNNSWPHSKLFKDLQECQDERNAFAHYYLLTPNSNDGTIITLTEFRDGAKNHGYTKDEYDDLIHKMNRLTSEIFDLFWELPERFDF
jgi:hypothetical protein